MAALHSMWALGRRTLQVLYGLDIVNYVTIWLFVLE